MKVIFIDIDGPLCPRRVYCVKKSNDEKQYFDPIVCQFLNKLITNFPVKMVISSAWQCMGLKNISDIFINHGIDPSYIHEDWCTNPEDHSGLTRAEEIENWLDRHPEVDRYAAIDDGDVAHLEGGVQCDFEDGLMTTHYEQILQKLDLGTFNQFISIGRKDIRFKA